MNDVFIEDGSKILNNLNLFKIWDLKVLAQRASIFGPALLGQIWKLTVLNCQLVTQSQTFEKIAQVILKVSADYFRSIQSYVAGRPVGSHARTPG